MHRNASYPGSICGWHRFPGVLRYNRSKPSVFRNPELPETLLPGRRGRVEKVKSLITPRRILKMDHERTEG